MEYILAIIALPVIWIVISRFIFSTRLSNKEIIIQTAVTILFVALAYVLSVANLTSDTELLNGQVTGKKSVRVSCSHSYKCMCYTTYSTDSKGRSSSTEHCSTCYDHSYDVDWRVQTNVGDLEINRIDRQGINTPPRWANVVIGEPATTSHSFENYIKGAKLSLFNNTDIKNTKKFAKMIPSYPMVFDYYRIHRVLSVGVSVPNLTKMNDVLNSQMRTLGPQKQANVIVVIVNADQTYRYALERAWVGGKKNDIIVLLGVTNYPTIDWVDTITIGNNSGNELLQVKMRDQVMYLHSLEKWDTIINVIASTVKIDYKRKPMKDFEYLKNQIQPSMTVMVIIWILTILCNIGLTFYFYNEEF